ncbi:MAG: lipopolysaccharide biosynthesis protein, partial [Nitrospinota bacterium]
MIKRAKNLVKHPLFSGSALMIGGSLAINGINYLYHLVMGRLLGPAGYGSLATIFSILYIVGIVPLSTSFAIVKYISGAKNERERSAIYKAIKSLLWKIGLVGLVVIIVFSPAMANFLHIDNFLEIALVGPILFFSLITLVNQSSMQGVLKFFGLVGPNSVSALAKLLFGVLLVY